MDFSTVQCLMMCETLRVTSKCCDLAGDTIKVVFSP